MEVIAFDTSANDDRVRKLKVVWFSSLVFDWDSVALIIDEDEAEKVAVLVVAAFGGYIPSPFDLNLPSERTCFGNRSVLNL